MNSILLLIACLVPQADIEGEWITVEPEKAGAIVLMPIQPKSVVRDMVVVKNRPKISVHLHVGLSGDKKTTFVFAYHDHYDRIKTRVQRNKILLDSVKGAHQTSGGELIKNREFMNGLNPGREFAVVAKRKDGKTYRISGRILIVGQRLYQTTSITEVDNFDAKIVVKFFKSFKLSAP